MEFSGSQPTATTVPAWALIVTEPGAIVLGPFCTTTESINGHIEHTNAAVIRSCSPQIPYLSGSTRSSLAAVICLQVIPLQICNGFSG